MRNAKEIKIAAANGPRPTHLNLIFPIFDLSSLRWHDASCIGSLVRNSSTQTAGMQQQQKSISLFDIGFVRGQLSIGGRRRIPLPKYGQRT